MKQKILLTAALFAVLLLAGCSKVSTWHGGKTIRCTVRTEMTKSGLVTDDSIKGEGFVMASYAESEWHHNLIAAGEAGSAENPNSPGEYFRSYVKFSGGSWKTYSSQSATDPTEYLWLNEVPLTFWCWNGAASFPSGGEPQYTVGSGELDFSYSAGSSAADDLVFAFNSEYRKFSGDGEIVDGESSGSRTDDMVDIYFIHALAEVNFIICVDGDDSFDSQLVVSDIAIENLYRDGSCTVDGSKCNASHFSEAFAWNSLSNAGACSQNFGPQTGTGSTWTDKYTGSGTASEMHYRKTGSSFFVIPQVLGSSAQIRISFDDGTSRTSSIAAQELVPGYYYTYKLSAHAKSIDFTATLVDWTDGGTITLTK